MEVDDEDADEYIFEKTYKRQCGERGQWLLTHPVCVGKYVHIVCSLLYYLENLQIIKHGLKYTCTTQCDLMHYISHMT